MPKMRVFKDQPGLQFYIEEPRKDGGILNDEVVVDIPVRLLTAYKAAQTRMRMTQEQIDSIVKAAKR